MWYINAYDKTKLKTNTKLVSTMSNMKTRYHFRLDFQKMYPQTGGERFINSAKERKDNPFENLEPLCRIS